LEETLFEEGTGIVSNIVTAFKSINDKIFSIYIAEDEDIDMHICFGKYSQEYIHKPKENPIKWVNNVYDINPEYYFLWRVPISNLLINIADLKAEDGPNLKLKKDI
jgi:hypothetical protein